MEPKPDPTSPRASLVYVTVASEADAKSLATTVVSERLAACANVLPHMTSVYRWKGAVQHEQEVVVLFKTSSARVAQLTRRVSELHHYENPCILALPVVAGAAAFVDWIVEETDR